MTPTPNAKTKRLAAQIARDLFTEGGSNIRAQRLVMEHTNGYGAGWAEGPMADRIAQILHAAQHPRPKGARP